MLSCSLDLVKPHLLSLVILAPRTPNRSRSRSTVPAIRSLLVRPNLLRTIRMAQQHPVHRPLPLPPTLKNQNLQQVHQKYRAPDPRELRHQLVGGLRWDQEPTHLGSATHITRGCIVVFSTLTRPLPSGASLGRNDYHA